MIVFLIALGVLLIGWGAIVLATGDFVATLDIAASLVSAGAIVIALAALVRSVDRLRLHAPARIEPPAPVATSPEPPRADVRPARAPVVEPVVANARPKLEAASIAIDEALAGASNVSPPEAPRPTPHAEPARPEPRVVPEGPRPSEPSVSETPSAAKLVREGVIDGRTYRFYSDGSIEADGPDGLRRYGSIDEAREEILRVRRERTEPTPPAVSTPPAQARQEPSQPRTELKAEARERTDEPQAQSSASSASRPAAAGAASAPASRNSSWQSYLSGRGASPKIDPTPEPAGQERAPEVSPPDVRPVAPQSANISAQAEPNWSESFRELLKREVGDADRSGPDRKS
ncbi:hypothetical protein [Terrihabitans sp. B22-R8]|uniref:hypothetical protein n=1 Tax=Terrihabitans sp. B22-R8 TaxID=3425128 RepID=UPI00403C30E5